MPDPPTVETAPPSPASLRRRGGVVRALRELRSLLRSGALARRLRERARGRLPHGGLAILTGHRVTRRRGPDPLGLALPVAALDRFLRALPRVGPILPCDQAIDRLGAQRLDPGLAFALSFDDGTIELLEHGVPVLRRHGARAAAFLSGSEAAPGGRFWWDTVEGGGRRADPAAFLAVADVLLVGHHGRAHRALEPLPEAELAGELEPLEVPTSPFLAYPFGRPEDAGPRAARAARAAGFRAAFTTRPAIARPGDDLFLLPRVRLLDEPVDGLLLYLLQLLGDSG